MEEQRTARHFQSEGIEVEERATVYFEPLGSLWQPTLAT
jgi:hypothetical protein